MEQENITIFGAGLVGSLLSIFLAKQGYQVKVYEKRADPRLELMKGNRSINLALSERGWRALREVGISNLVFPIGIPMRGRMMHDLKGNLTFQPYGNEEQAIYSVSRADLNKTMIEEADRMPNTEFHFENACQHVNLYDNSYQIRQHDKLRTEAADIIFGADGAFSQVRSAMQRTDRFNYSQYYLAHGYKEMTILPSPQDDFRMNPNALHIWPRRKFMLIALPNPDKTFTVTLFLPFEGDISFQNLQTPQAVAAFFDTYFADAVALIENPVAQFFENPTSSMVTVTCAPWTYQNRVALVGDAAHAIVPFYGQGMNAGFEDCRILNDIIAQNQGDWAKIMQKYRSERTENANAISELALHNFIEMRDKVADDKFLLRKKIEANLHQLYPTKWMPLYSMVTFSHIPYAQALARGKKQEHIMNQVLATPNIETIWHELDFEEIIFRLDNQ